MGNEQVAGNSVNEEQAREVVRVLKILESRSLKRDALILLVADSVSIRGNWGQKKRIVKEVFAMAERLAVELNFQRET